MKAMKLLPVLAVAFVLLAVPMIPVSDGADEAAVDFGSEAADLAFGAYPDDPANEWYGICFLVIFIIGLVVAVYYGYFKRD